MKNNEDYSQAFYGWETFVHKFKMKSKFMLELSILVGLLQLVITFALTKIFCTAQYVEIFWKYLVSKAAAYVGLNLNLSLPTAAGDYFPSSGFKIVKSAAIQQISSEVFYKILFAFVLSFAVWLLFPLITKIMRGRGEKLLGDQFIRGSKLVEPEVLAKEVRKKPGTIPIGKITLPTEYEPEHILVAGKTRVGKTVATIQAIHALRQKNHKAVIHDFRGELVARFYNPATDIILNPLDARATGWDFIGGDIESRAELTSAWDSLIPPSSGDDKFWCSAAAAVGKGVSAYLWTQGKKTNKDLWEALTSPTEKIAEMCKATPSGQAGYKAIEDVSSKQAAGVMAVMLQYVSWLEFAVDGGPFSINKWLAQEKGGFIFLTGKQEIKETLKPMTGLFIEMLGKKILNLPEDPARRVYFILDEFNNLQKLPTLPELLSGAGAQGAIFWLAIQDVARIKKVYGQEMAESILNSCGCWLTLKLKDVTTAKVFSEAMGQYQYWQSNSNYRMSAADQNDGETVSRAKQTEWLVMPSEIQSLKKREAYLVIPDHDACKLLIEIKPENNTKPTQEKFILRDGWMLDDLIDKQLEIKNAIEENTELIIKDDEPAVDVEESVSTLAAADADFKSSAGDTGKKVSLDIL